jgi:acyl carrier protein
MNNPSPELRQEIKRLIIESLNLEDVVPQDIDDESPLFGNEGLGLDSIDALELGVALRKKYNVTLEADDPNVKTYFRSVTSLAQWLGPILSARASG